MSPIRNPLALATGRFNQPSSRPFSTPLSSLEPKQWLSFFDIPSIDSFPLDLKTSWHPLPYAYCKEHELLPFKELKDTCFVATSTPLDLKKAKYLRLILNKSIKLYYCPQEVLLNAIEKAFCPDQKKTQNLIASLSSKESHSPQKVKLDLLEEDRSQSPAIQLLNSILQEAYQQKASDIHFESTKDGLNIRYRIDGVLQKRHTLESLYQSALLTRLKILSNLDISEQRRPQDGRFQLKIGQKDLDFRLSSLPTSFGERIVIRLLDPSRMNLNLKNLGLNESTLNELAPMIHRKEGLFLVTGPTGSGKTTTLYSIIKEIQKSSLNIMTIEDPVEYQIPSISQMNVHPGIGLTFSKGLRHILRQDPDIILIGEIRDFETAQIAIQASLTGHLVLSTLHTNDSPSSITRLIEMGIEPYLLSASLIGILAQRLVRKICPFCKVPISFSLKKSQKPQDPLVNNLKSYQGKGCESCFHTGYLGRMGLYELMFMSPKMKQATMQVKEGVSVAQVALKEGLKTLYQQGLEEVKKGETSIEEVLRVSLSQNIENKEA